MFLNSKALSNKTSLTKGFVYIALIIFSLNFDTVVAESHGAKAPSGGSAIKSPIASKPRKKRIRKVDPSKKEFEEPKALTGEKDFSDKDAPELDESIETVIVLDNSRSMTKTDPKRIRDQGAKLFLQFLEPSDHFSIVQFADEAKVVVPFIKLSNTTPEDVSDALKSINNDGNFTDFLSGIELAQSLFDESKNPKTMSKALIILTDGQNDPNPAKHSSAQVRDEILRNRIPALKKKGIRVFTLALSQLADRAFLTEISKESNGLSWYANDVNDVHRVFSDLFLSLKKPQVLELTDEGFEIDSSSQEATFFVSRSSESDSISVIDPMFREFTNKGFPANWKWFRGPLFDVITVPSPLPGRWLIKGGKDGSGSDISGFAKLLTDLNLEHDWPEGTLEVGNTAILKVRLNGDPVVLGDPQLKGLLFYSYKIINLKTGTVYQQGKLTDDGRDGDKTASDNVFSSSITLNEEGDFKMFVSVIGPTFSRQVHVPVSVTRGMISLEYLKANNFNVKKDQYFVKLHGDARGLKNRKVSLVAELVGKPDSTYGIKLTRERHDEPIFDIDTTKLKPGRNKVYAIVSGKNSHGKEERAKSEEIIVDVEGHGEDRNHYEKIEHHPSSDHSSDADSHGAGSAHDSGSAHESGNEDDEAHSLHESIHGEEDTLTDADGDGEGSSEEELVEENSDWAFGFIGVLVNLILSFFIARLFIKKSKQEDGVSIEVRPPYQIDEELSAKIETILSNASSTKKRGVKPEEIAIFSMLPEVSSGLSSISSDVGGGDSSADSDAAESEDVPEGEVGDASAGDSESTSSATVENEETPVSEGNETEADTEASEESAEQEASEPAAEDASGEDEAAEEAPAAEEVSATESEPETTEPEAEAGELDETAEEDKPE